MRIHNGERNTDKHTDEVPRPQTDGGPRQDDFKAVNRLWISHRRGRFPLDFSIVQHAVVVVVRVLVVADAVIVVKIVGLQRVVGKAVLGVGHAVVVEVSRREEFGQDVDAVVVAVVVKVVEVRVGVVAREVVAPAITVEVFALRGVAG